MGDIAVATYPRAHLDGVDQVVHVVDSTHVEHALEALSLSEPRAVLVLIGGAGDLSEAHAAAVRVLLDRGVLPAARSAGALVISGGTSSGVMQLIGEVSLGWPGVELLGVAPRRQVRHVMEAVEDDDGRVVLDPNHHKFVLTAGETWGSETNVLLALAKELTAEREQGVVLLANGGDVSRSEAAAFMAAGWPVLALAGTGRAADQLTSAVQRRGGWRARWLEVLGFEPSFDDRWEGLRSADVEVHDISHDSVELLNRRIRWRLNRDRVTRSAWARFGAFDSAARSEQAWTRRFQGALAVGALLLAVLSVAYGILGGFGPLKWILLALPLFLAVGSTLSDTLVPSRNWLALRHAAESVQHAIYRRQAARLNGDADADAALVALLAVVDQDVLRAGVPLGVITESAGRPASLPQALNEFADPTRAAYVTDRVVGQLRYYRTTAQKLRRRELLTVGTSAALAGSATAVASETFAAVWIPILILAASTIVILRQRARWQDKVSLCSAAVAELDSVRTRAVALDDGQSPIMPLREVILETEAVLERENADWHQAMNRSLLDASRYQHPLANGLK
ncbi:DUF4231 domain-containing protein [Modestobacter sp. SYSU DS0875]